MFTIVITGDGDIMADIATEMIQQIKSIYLKYADLLILSAVVYGLTEKHYLPQNTRETA